ncbi:MAG: LuxR C-terminal-related transcriptional regulator [Pseudomonadota bacterium]
MTRNKQEYTEQAGPAQVIDRLYDVEINPIHYEELIDAWENTFSLDGSNGDVPPDDNDEVFGGHARRASALLDRHQIVQPDNTKQSRLHDVKTRAAFLTDGFGKLLAVNGIASKTMGISDGAPMSALPFHAPDLESLKEIAVNVGKQNEPVSVVMRIRRSDNNKPVLLRITPVENDGSLNAVLVVLAEIVWLDGFSDNLCQTFKLTPAEAEVVRHIVSGLPANDIALARQTSVQTVRTQIKSILDKTEAHSQTELVRTVVGLLDVISLTPDNGSAIPVTTSMDDTKFQTMTLSDGRRYEFRVFGDPEGLNCLYMHMDFGFVVWPEEAERAALSEGLRVIVPVRAGYGNSTLPVFNSDFRKRTVNDMVELLDHLEVDKFVALTQGSDLRFATAMAAETEGRMMGIIGCAAQLPLQNAAQYERMDKWQRFINWNARYAPKLLPFLVKAGFSLAQRIGKERFFEAVNGGSRADMQAFSNPAVRQAVLVGTNVCLSDEHIAHKAFSLEVIDHEDDWIDSLRDCPVPIELFQGDQDPQSPLDTVNEIIAGMDHIKMQVVENTGQILFFTAWPHILPRVKQLFDA